MIIKLNSRDHLIHKSTSILEVSRSYLLTKSRSQSRSRYNKRMNHQVTDFRGVDLEELFENDYFVFTTPIKDYAVTVAFSGVFQELKDVVRMTAGDPNKITLQMVIKALSRAYDSADDVRVNCTCPDYFYRYSYVASRGGYKFGEPQNIPARITNPNNDIGATCKHLDLLLSNKRWLTKAASVINSFIKAYPAKASAYLYDTYSAPDYEDDDEDIIDLSVAPEETDGDVPVADNDEIIELDTDRIDQDQEDEEDG